MSFSLTGPLIMPRTRHTAVLAGDGRVLIVGDNARLNTAGTAELFELR